MSDHGMFSFLFSEAPNQNTSLDVLKEFAKQAASSFLGKDKVPLNHTIQKTAQVENWTPNEIEIVCQESNKEVHGYLFKTAENKYVDFELADSSFIVSNIEESLSKTATVNHEFFQDDFKSSPSEKRGASQGDFQLTKTAGHDGIKTSQAQLDKTAAIRKQATANELNENILILNAQIESAENRMVKIARNQLMPFSLKERPAQFPYIAKFCKLSGLSEDSLKRVLHLTEVVMKKQGMLEKSADIKVSPDLISDDLNARVQNGTHPLFIEIKTIVDKEQQRDSYKNLYNRIQTELTDYKAQGSILGQRVKEL